MVPAWREWAWIHIAGCARARQLMRVTPLAAMAHLLCSVVGWVLGTVTGVSRMFASKTKGFLHVGCDDESDEAPWLKVEQEVIGELQLLLL
jgi:hypothetical protein